MLNADAGLHSRRNLHICNRVRSAARLDVHEVSGSNFDSQAHKGTASLFPPIKREAPLPTALLPIEIFDFDFQTQLMTASFVKWDTNLPKEALCQAARS